MTDYPIQDWQDGFAGGTPLSAARLDHMEAGINTAADEVTTALTSIGVLQNAPCCILQHTADQTATSDSELALTFNTEVLDFPSGTMHTGGSPTRIVFPSNGVYLCMGSAEFDINTTNERSMWIRHSSGTDYGAVEIDAPTNTYAGLTVVTLVPAVTNEYVELMVLQNSGGNLAVKARERMSATFSVIRLGDTS